MIWKRFLKNKSLQLLLSLILLFFSPLPSALHGAGTYVLPALSLLTLLSIIRQFYSNSRSYRALILLFGVGIGLTTSSNMEAFNGIQTHLGRASDVVISFFFILAIWLLMRKIFNQKVVDGETIINGISIYLLIGLLWYFFYHILAPMDPSLVGSECTGRHFTCGIVTSNQLIYFSFTTLTTLGYGDINPISDAARSLTNMEAIIGQIYPAIFLARLVGMYERQGTNEG